MPEDRPIDLNAAVEPYVGAAVTALGIAVLVLLVIVVVQARRIGKLGKRLDGLTRGADGRSLEAVLDAHLDKVFGVANEVDSLSARSAVLEANGRKAVQRVGLVRFNPFEETGGNQSFALALTDANGDGLVISSLHARAGTRLYAKSVVAGKSDAALSAEEAEALRIALSAPLPRPAPDPARSGATV
ncbi:MAG TPA: DUF4446 family protein [Candidatus Limnocylindrales bacterium]|nr:DUF4446 family protein [Candidatus Limnocylindrales bacterium]